MNVRLGTPRCAHGLARDALGILLLGAAIAAASDVSIPVAALDGTAEAIPATISRPGGAGPFPAVVILHDCSGLGPSSSGSPARWAKELVARGYVVLLPDSFSTRGHAGGVCTNPSPSRNEVAPLQRVRDAYAALSYLRTLDYVDGRRVGLMGGSHGGSTALFSMGTRGDDAEALASEKRAGFAAAVALYPGCRAPSRRVASPAAYRAVGPVLILIGEKDDWTPAEPCQQLADAARSAGFPVAISVYPGAHHAFDSDRPVRYVATRVNANAPGGRGATTGGDAKAWAQSRADVAAFFGQHLQGKNENAAR